MSKFLDDNGLLYFWNKIKAKFIAEPSTDGTNGQVLTTNGSGGRSWTSVSLPSTLGTIYTATNSAAVAMTANTATKLCALSLPAGTFIINGQAYFKPTSTAGEYLLRYQCGISTGVSIPFNNVSFNNNCWYGKGYLNNGYNGLPCSAILKLTGSTSVLLVASLSSTGTCPAGYGHMVAVRIL